MTLLEIFEKVNLVVPLEQRRFFNYFEDTVNELLTLYDGFVLKKNAEKLWNELEKHGLDAEYAPPKELCEDCIVLPLYHNAIADNILFLAGSGEAYKSEFMRKSKLAYLKYWNDNAKGRQVKKTGW